MASVIFLLCLQCWISNILCSLFELSYPVAIKVNDGDILEMRSVFINNEIYNGKTGELMANMTGRAYCVNDICSIPAPTLIVYPEITVYISLNNSFDTNFIDHDDLNGPDITNIHSHGLHISGAQDNVFETIHPSEHKIIEWKIHRSHHIGTNWYHAHHHKAVKIQVMMGMYGALIVDSAYNKLDIDYNEQKEINDYILHISWLYVDDNQICNNCVDYDPGKYTYFDSFKRIESLCFSWCEYSDIQRANSGYNYDVIINGSKPFLEVFVVNNIYQPTISKLESNTYFKLRLIHSSSSLYVQFSFDLNNITKCEYSLIARDGIALKDNRDLRQYPYFGYFLLPPGGRIDVLVICKGNGTAAIYHNEIHPNYAGINVSYPFGRIQKQLLFELNIEQNSKSIQDIPFDVKYMREREELINPEIDNHLRYPEPIWGYPYYLAELIDSTNDEIVEICSCSNYNRNETEDPIVKNTNYCSLELLMGNDLNFEINGMVFNHPQSEPIFMISLNEIYQFYINSDGHPIHIHVNPFMVQRDLLNGYIAKKGDIMDTLGYNYINPDDPYHEDVGGDDPYNEGFLIRYNTRDYVGDVVIHCHFLGHEDEGMMAFMKIIDDDTDNSTYCQNQYGFGIQDHIIFHNEIF